MGTITGHRTLEAERTYLIPANPDPSWQLVDQSHLVTVEFSNDSTFSFSSNYHFAVDQYKRFTPRIDSVDFRIYATTPPTGGNFPLYPSVFVKMVNHNVQFSNHFIPDLKRRLIY